MYSAKNPTFRGKINQRLPCNLGERVSWMVLVWRPTVERILICVDGTEDGGMHFKPLSPTHTYTVPKSGRSVHTDRHVAQLASSPMARRARTNDILSSHTVPSRGRALLWQLFARDKIQRSNTGTYRSIDLRISKTPERGAAAWITLPHKNAARKKSPSYKEHKANESTH